MAKKRSKYDKDDPEAILARGRGGAIIDSVLPADLISLSRRTPSLRGMVLGYLAEEMFERHLLRNYAFIRPGDIDPHDDNDARLNKSDRTIRRGGRLYRVQLKPIQTNSIRRNLETGRLQANVQNEASDSRTVALPNGNSVSTSCYARGDYDILAVALFPFSGDWSYAYMRNSDCRRTTNRRYSAKDSAHLLAATEIITWPLSEGWRTDFAELLDDRIGIPA